MGILENWREIRKYYPWRSSNAHHGWVRVIPGFSFVAVFFGVSILGSAVVGGKTASTGALITVTVVAITAGVIAGYGLSALRYRLPLATSQRVGLVAFWVAVLAAVGVLLALAFR